MKTKSLLAALCALLAAQLLPAAAAFPDPIPLYPGKTVAPDTEILIERANNLDDAGYNRRAQKVVNPTLSIYHPAKQDASKTALVICPGGGYTQVVFDREGHAYARRFAQAGITCAVLKYRLPDAEDPGQKLPVPQQDVLAAIAHLRANAGKLNINPNRIGVIGSSAGGHLACSAATLSKPGDMSRPDFVALLYPVIKMDGPDIHKGSRDQLLGLDPAPALLEKFSLQTQIRPDMPPFFINHSANDNAVPVTNSTDLAAALGRAKIPFELHVIPVGGHGYSLGNEKLPETQVWPDQFLNWLTRLP